MLFTAIVRDVTERKRYEAGQRELEQLRARAEFAERKLTPTSNFARPPGSAKRPWPNFKCAIDELKVTTQQLWQAARLAGVGELAASIAHELNNPLGTVRLQRRTDPDQNTGRRPRRKPLEVIAQEVERMGNLVANLLQFSRAGRDQVSTIDVCEEITKTVDLVAHHFAQAANPRRTGLRCAGCRRRSTPTASNCGKYFEPLHQRRGCHAEWRTARARVREGELPGGAPAIVIEIADTGHGIPTQLLNRVFDPFFTTKEEGKGPAWGWRSASGSSNSTTANSESKVRSGAEPHCVSRFQCATTPTSRTYEPKTQREAQKL